jgi:hypothetical protein
MDRAIETLLEQVHDALLALRRRPGATFGAQLDDLDRLFEDRLRRAATEGDLAAAVEAVRAMHAQVAELPLPAIRLNPGQRAEILSAQVELLRATIRLHHHLEPPRDH